jgi:hypothetical protein
MENKFLSLSSLKQFEYICLAIDLNQNVKQIAELQFSKGMLFHTKGEIFGCSGSFDYQFNTNLKTFESNTRGDHIKSSKFNIECPQEFADSMEPIVTRGWITPIADLGLRSGPRS